MRRLAVALMLVIAIPAASAQMPMWALSGNAHDPLVIANPGDQLDLTGTALLQCISAADWRDAPLLEAVALTRSTYAVSEVDVAYDEEPGSSPCFGAGAVPVSKMAFPISYSLELLVPVDARFDQPTLVEVLIDGEGGTLTRAGSTTGYSSHFIGINPQGGIEAGVPDESVDVGNAIPLGVRSSLNGDVDVVVSIIDGPGGVAGETTVTVPYGSADAVLFDLPITDIGTGWSEGWATIRFDVPGFENAMPDWQPVERQVYLVNAYQEPLNAEVPMPAAAPIGAALLGLVAARRRLQ